MNPVLNPNGVQCKALILKTNSLSLFTAQLHASRHMFTPTPKAAFGKGGILRLRFRKTRQQIAAFTLEQMCRLFYLKMANLFDINNHLMFISSFSASMFRHPC